jgi:protein gp37
MRMAARLEAMGVPKYQGLTRKSGGRSVWTGKVALDQTSLRLPYRWRKPRTVFVNSMADLFHEAVDVDFIRQVWEVMQATPQHTYQVLTKRAARMADILRSHDFPVLPNVWVGASVEDNRVLDRIDHLRSAPAAIRFISFEPLIGSVAEANLADIHWAIVGGESGPAARTLNETWVEEIEALCREKGTAFFFKQWGGRNKKAAGRTFKGQTFNEMPALAA